MIVVSDMTPIISLIKIVSVQNKKSLEVLQKITGLDDGESESIIIVDEQKSDLLIMDERKG